MPALLQLYDWVVASIAERNALSPNVALGDVGKVCQVRDPEGGSTWYRFDGYDSGVSAIWTPITPPPQRFTGIDPEVHAQLLHGVFTIEWTPTAASWAELQTTLLTLLRWGGQTRPYGWVNDATQAEYDAVQNCFVIDRWHWNDGSRPDTPTLVYWSSISDHWTNDDGSIGEDAYSDYVWIIHFTFEYGQRIRFTFDIPRQAVTIEGAATGNGTYQSRETRAQGSDNLYFIEFGTGGNTPAGNPYWRDEFYPAQRLLNVYANYTTHWESREDLGDESVLIGGFGQGFFPAVPPIEGVITSSVDPSSVDVSLTLAAAPTTAEGVIAGSAEISLDLGAPSITRVSGAADAALTLTAAPAALGSSARADASLAITAAPVSTTMRSAVEASFAITAAPRSTRIDVPALEAALALTAAPQSARIGLPVLDVALQLVAAPVQMHPVRGADTTTASLWLSASPRAAQAFGGAADVHSTLAVVTRPSAPLQAPGADVALGLVAAPGTRDVNHPLVASATLSATLAFTAAPQVLGEEPPPLEVQGNLLMMFL